MGPARGSGARTTIRLVRVEEGLSLWWLGTAAMAVARELSLGKRKSGPTQERERVGDCERDRAFDPLRRGDAGVVCISERL
jgi:hypothetical protein